MCSFFTIPPTWAAACWLECKSVNLRQMLLWLALYYSGMFTVTNFGIDCLKMCTHCLQITRKYYFSTNYFSPKKELPSKEVFSIEYTWSVG